MALIICFQKFRRVHILVQMSPKFPSPCVWFSAVIAQPAAWLCLPRYNLSCICLAGGKSHRPVTHRDYFILRSLLWFVLSQWGKKGLCRSHCVKTPLLQQCVLPHEREGTIPLGSLLEEVSSPQHDSQLIWLLGKLKQHKPTFACSFFLW